LIHTSYQGAGRNSFRLSLFSPDVGSLRPEESRTKWGLLWSLADFTVFSQPNVRVIAHDMSMSCPARELIRRILLAGVVVGCFVVAGTRSASGQAGRKPDITGTWILNRELSDRPGTVAGRDGGPGDEGGRSPRGGGRGGRGRGGPGGMPGRGRFGGRGGDQMPNQEEMEQMRAAMTGAMRMSPRVIIVTAETGYRVTEDDGVSLRIPAEGKKDIGAVNGALFETTAKWQDGKLRVERKFKVGLKVTDEYAVAGEPRVLTVTSTVEGIRRRGDPPKVKRVYDLEPR
jgi:hypothetical protein